MKEIVSGDTVVIVGNTQGLTVPQEKRLTLSSLIAPRLASRSVYCRVGCKSGSRKTEVLMHVG